MRTGEDTIITFNTLICGAIGLSAVSGASPLLALGLGFFAATLGFVLTSLMLE